MKTEAIGMFKKNKQKQKNSGAVWQHEEHESKTDEVKECVCTNGTLVSAVRVCVCVTVSVSSIPCRVWRTVRLDSDSAPSVWLRV